MVDCGICKVLTRKSEREQKWGKGGELGPGYVVFCMLEQDLGFITMVKGSEWRIRQTTVSH